MNKHLGLSVLACTGGFTPCFIQIMRVKHVKSRLYKSDYM